MSKRVMIIGLAFRFVNYNQTYIRNSRCIHSSAMYMKSSSLKTEKRKVGAYVLSRYLEYVKNYESVLEKRFPSAMRVYRVFSIGIKDFYKDMKQYIDVSIKVVKEKNGQGLSMLNRSEIEIYYQMPKDMWKVAPVLILSALPFANYVIFPLAYLKPRVLLSSHFWSIEQKANFSVVHLTKRLNYNRSVFRALQARQKNIEELEMRLVWRKVLDTLGSGAHPSVDKITKCKELFQSVYHLDNLNYNHIRHLLKMHGLHTGWMRRKRLKKHAFIIHEIDKAIIREGGVANLPLESLKMACFTRGLNSNISTQEMRDWMDSWLQISRLVNQNSYSLLLHCPILLAYNKPQNWSLIY